MEKLVVVSCILATLLLSARGDEEQARGGNPHSYFHDPQNVHNKEHLKEHMSEHYQVKDMDDQVKLDSNEAMEFHYFKLHDYDGNNKLDGLELRVALTHVHDEPKEGNLDLPTDDLELATLIKQILKEDDLNDDGFIDYYEFMVAQQEKEPEPEP